MPQEKLRESLIKLINETLAIYMCISESELETNLNVINKGFVIKWDDHKGHILRVTYYNNEDSLKEVRFWCNDPTRLPYYRTVIFKTTETTVNLSFPKELTNIKITEDNSANIQSMKTIAEELKNIILHSNNWEIL